MRKYNKRSNDVHLPNIPKGYKKGRIKHNIKGELGHIENVQSVLDATIPNLGRLPAIYKGNTSDQNNSDIINKIPINNSLGVRQINTDDPSTVTILDRQYPVHKESSSFEKRKSYGRNLERNWFTHNLKKSVPSEYFHLNLLSNSETDFSLSQYGYSAYSRETHRSTSPPLEGHVTNRKKYLTADDPNMFVSTDVLVGEKGQLDESSSSDYETELRENNIVAKKTKHKMRKVRRQKYDQFRKRFEDEEYSELELRRIAGLTEKQLRAMRLKLATPRNIPKLTGIHRFRQVVNAVCIGNYFVKVLKKVRRKRQKLALGVVKKFKKRPRTKPKQTKKQVVERMRTPSPFTLKKQFLIEGGYQLIEDVTCMCAHLNLSDIPELTPEIASSLISKIPKKQELGKLVRRRGSDAGSIRPDMFKIVATPSRQNTVDQNDKSKRKRSPKKGLTRNAPMSKHQFQTPDVKKCTCILGKLENENPEQKNLMCICSFTKPVEPPKQKKKVVMFDKQVIFDRFRRRPSLDTVNFKDKPIELDKLFEEIDFPAKDVRIQILLRKMRKPKKRKVRKKYEERRRSKTPERLHESPVEKEKEIIEEVAEDNGSDERKLRRGRSQGRVEEQRKVIDCFVSGTGVAWNKKRTPTKYCYTENEIQRELHVARASDLFMEMKDVSYLRIHPLYQAVKSKLHEQSQIC